MDHEIIKFEVGDYVHCSYYNVTGQIESFTDNGLKYVNIRTEAGDIVNSQIRMNVSGRAAPYYLQMVCKASDVSLVLVKALGLK